MGSRQGIELLAYLPQPAAEDREQAFKLFQDKLLAYPSGSTVVIVDVRLHPNLLCVCCDCNNVFHRICQHQALER